MLRKVLYVCFSLVAIVSFAGWGCAEIKIHGGIETDENITRHKNYRLEIVVEDAVGNSDVCFAYSDLTPGNQSMAYRTDFEVSHMDRSSMMTIRVKVYDQETGQLVGEKEYFRYPPDGDWKTCLTINLESISVLYSASSIPTGTAKGTIVNGSNQQPVNNVNVHSSPGMDTKTDSSGHYSVDNIPTGPTDIVVNAPDPSFFLEENEDYLRTWLNINMPADSGIVSPPISLISKEDWDSLSAHVQDSLGIEQLVYKAFVFGKILNQAGEPIPDVEVSFDPPSGEAVYLDPMNWGFADRTKIRNGFHLSASFAVFNVDVHDWPDFDYRMVAVHSVTGDTIGTFEDMATPPFDWAVVQADIFADDAVAPSAVSDLAKSVNGNVTLTWTAPGDDGTSGQAYAYDIRYSDTPIDGDLFTWWWEIADVEANPPSPGPPGSTENFVVSQDASYYIIKTTDECMNWSGFSNVVSGVEESPISSTPEVKLDVSPIFSEDNVLIKYSIPRKSNLNLSIYTADGRKVASLESGSQPDGIHTVTWDSAETMSGLYFCKLEVDGMTLTEKVVLLR
ncbi:T9SS type A sorting domain-containing protein [candidate division WOR-3 bacterium]|uniref:T9SS type A sorting domain-containing protein n=1 Tax=candidate division WOR-3 bacterium TaxID=2052148 RepID=A0A9D5K920_UNCW3|nr:T9SS type A sorting domain-containing protein [candidate division WOR-3 bacterium]MBD3363636.1 T9SS type A sorting domain-containing protein [candidate division WOR-3 bacterium]